MSNYALKFKHNRHVYIENLLTENECQEALYLLIEAHKKGESYFDKMCPKSISFGSGTLKDLQNKKLKLFEEILELKLIPTYNFNRIYKSGEKLPKHIDRYACEISVTLNIGYIGEIWPIYFLDRNDSAENYLYYKDSVQCRGINMGDEAFSPFMNTNNKIRYDIKKGAGVFYRGCELIHWRDEYVEGKEQAQVFFHFVNANGPYRDLDNKKQNYDFSQMSAGIV